MSHLAASAGMTAAEQRDQPFGTLADLIDAYARERPDHIAVADGATTLTYRALARLIGRVAASLQRDGVKTGEAVAICAASSIPYIASFVGILKAGAAVAPLSPSTSRESLRAMLDNCGAQQVFIDSASRTLIGEVSGVAMIELDGADGESAWPTWLAPEDVAPASIPISPDAPFNIIYSSGTTGTPKGVVQPHSFRWSQLRWSFFDAEAVTLVSTGLYSNTTLVVALPTLAAGGTVVLMARFDAAAFLKLSERWRVSHAMLVPVQYSRLLKLPDFDQADLSSYRFKFCTSAPFAAELKAEVLRRWPGGLVEFYGMTEGGGICVLMAHEHPDKLATVGRPMEGHDIRIIDEAGRERPVGEAGEVVGRSAGMMSGYFNLPEKTREAEWFSPEGLRFIRTGDVGRFDADGFLTITDRIKDMIISGGFNIYPSDLEAELMREPGVAEAAVFGVASERWGETPQAAVVAKPDHHLSAAALRDSVNARLGKIQRLAAVQIVDQLPRNAIGKVLKRQLRETFGPLP